MKIASTLKRMFLLTLVVALLAGAFALPVACASSGSYYCTANRVNLRSGPSSSYASEAKLMKGDVVTYISKSNGWYKVSYYSKKSNSVIEGYVYRKYLSSVAPTSTKSSSSKSSISLSTNYKTTVNLRVRSEPSITSGYVRAKLKKGTKVSVVKQKKSWVYVTYKGGSGWVSAKYLSKVYK
ncbi:MAG: SH3 domain-containing protein [Clostridia bacterium]|nr:SH3 domain-containing protein [Clostridia bacterium]